MYDDKVRNNVEFRVDISCYHTYIYTYGTSITSKLNSGDVNSFVVLFHSAS